MGGTRRLEIRRQRQLRGAKVVEWIKQTTSIAGTQVPNWALVLGAIIVIWIIYRLFSGQSAAS